MNCWGLLVSQPYLLSNSKDNFENNVKIRLLTHKKQYMYMFTHADSYISKLICFVYFVNILDLCENKEGDNKNVFAQHEQVWVFVNL